MAFSIKRSVLGLTLVPMVRFSVETLFRPVVLHIVSWIRLVIIVLVFVFLAVSVLKAAFLNATVQKVFFVSVLLPLLGLLSCLTVALTDCVSTLNSEVRLHSHHLSWFFEYLQVFFLFELLLSNVLWWLSGGLAIPSLGSSRGRLLLSGLFMLLPRWLVWFLLFLYSLWLD